MSLSGVIKIAMSEPGFSPSHAFDREKSDFHYLTVEARDELGEGNRNTVEVLLHLVDVNDNAPIFRQDSYETSIAENDDRFTSPFVVSAGDKVSFTLLKYYIRVISIKATFLVFPLGISPLEDP